MSQDIEVIPVTADEIMWLLGSTTMEEVERLLDDIKMFRERRIFNRVLIIVNTPLKQRKTIK